MNRRSTRLTGCAAAWVLLAATGFAVVPGTAQAQPAQAGLAASATPTFYGNLYPEWLVQGFGKPSAAGTVVGTLGTLRNDRTALTADAKGKPDSSSHAWSNSYVGLRGAFRGEAVEFGYDLQLVVDLHSPVLDTIEWRDAFVYAQTPGLGRLAVGKMDSIYKEYGDRVRMLGVSSSNIVSTAKVLSGVGWKGQGETSFNQRRGNMVTWYGPTVAGFQPGASLAADDAVGDGRTSSLASAALRWAGGPWYAALATEQHRNWLPMSRGAIGAATSILNNADTSTSRDRAWRLSTAWIAPRIRIGADVSKLSYSESDSVELPGKFRGYRTSTWQISGEYEVDSRVRLAANHAHAVAGSCVLSGGVACSTTGMGGMQTSLGILIQLNRNVGVFGLAVKMHNRPGAIYGSAPQGADVNSVAVGVKVDFD